MTRHIEIITVKENDRERIVKVTVDAPYPEELDVQYLAQKAWLMRSKRLKRGNVTVKVEGIGR
jgi:hypothetical protein